MKIVKAPTGQVISSMRNVNMHVGNNNVCRWLKEPDYIGTTYNAYIVHIRRDYKNKFKSQKSCYSQVPVQQVKESFSWGSPQFSKSSLLAWHSRWFVLRKCAWINRVWREIISEIGQKKRREIGMRYYHGWSSCRVIVMWCSNNHKTCLGWSPFTKGLLTKEPNIYSEC